MENKKYGIGILGNRVFKVALKDYCSPLMVGNLDYVFEKANVKLRKGYAYIEGYRRVIKEEDRGFLGFLFPFLGGLYIDTERVKIRVYNPIIEL